MTSAAVIIGIDGYAAQPLTSAVNDASDSRSTVLELRLVSDLDITLLTWPLGPLSDGRADGRHDPREAVGVLREPRRS
jgi:hypothetical protein